jgi:hypothetical protein
VPQRLEQDWLTLTVMEACEAITANAYMVDSLIKVSDAGPFIVALFTAISYLSTHSHNMSRVELRSSGAPEAVVDTANSYTANAAVAFSSCIVISNFASSNEHIRKELIVDGVDAALMSVMIVHPSNANVRGAAQSVLSHSAPRTYVEHDRLLCGRAEL